MPNLRDSLLGVSGAVADSGLLTWAPPTLTSPTTYHISNGSTNFVGTGNDAIMVFDSIVNVDTTLIIKNFRNVRLIGGEMDGVGSTQTCLRIRGCSGTVHIEGLWLKGLLNTAPVDLIAFNDAKPSGTQIVQIQNCRIGPNHGVDPVHPDGIQDQGSQIDGLRLDRLTITTELQAIFLKSAGLAGGYMTNVDIRNVNVSGIPGANLFWQELATTAPITMQNVWLDGTDPARPNLSNMVYPDATGLLYDSTPTTRKFVQAADGLSGSWINTNIAGTVFKGQPPRGDFCPAGVAGMSYVSPGYL